MYVCVCVCVREYGYGVYINVFVRLFFTPLISRLDIRSAYAIYKPHNYNTITNITPPSYFSPAKQKHTPAPRVHLIMPSIMNNSNEINYRTALQKPDCADNWLTEIEIEFEKVSEELESQSLYYLVYLWLPFEY